MRWLLIYKGEYNDKPAGPEIRYLRLGKTLAARGDQVIIAGKARQSRQVTASGLDYLCIHQTFTLIRQFFAAEVVVLHGGGPLLMLLALLSGVFGGTRLVLDTYALHWIELYQAQQTGRRGNALTGQIKIQYNLLRFLFALAVFDNVVVANQRQLDLARGALAAIGLLSQLGQRIWVIPFGCDPVVKQKSKAALIDFSEGQIAEKDIVIGWLGGAWDWFDMDHVVHAFAACSNAMPDSKYVFFGVSTDRFKQLLAVYGQAGGCQGQLLNLPWIAMDARLDTWSGIDLAVVWGSENIENDYASRTRNFDCISAGVPIVQNWDDQWGPLIRDHNCGAIAPADELSSTLVAQCQDRKTLAGKSAAIMALYPEFSWTRCADRFAKLNTVRKRGLPGRAVALLLGMIWLPIFLLLGIYDFVAVRMTSTAR